MVYKWRENVSFPVDAQIAGERLEQIRGAHGGTIAPADVVKDARSKDSPLHPCFEWSDKRAAGMYREDQARQLIRSVQVVNCDDSGEQTREIAYVSVALPYSKAGGCYMATREAVANPDTREIVLSSAVSALKGWKARYGHLNELASVVEAIDDLMCATS